MAYLNYSSKPFNLRAGSPLEELRRGLASRPMTEDEPLEHAFSSVLRLHFCKRQGRIEKPLELETNYLGWPEYISRFIIHFIKGIFFGVGIFTMDRMLATKQLTRLWVYLHQKISLVFCRQLEQDFSRSTSMTLVNIIAWIATCSTLGYFFANGFQAYQIVSGRSTSDKSFLPFVTTYLNCMLWLKYGIYKGDLAVVVVNGFGSAISFISILIYYLYSPNKTNIEKKTLYALGIIFLIFIITRSKWIHPQLMGFSAMTASILMFASPLSLIRTIVKRRDISSLSFPSLTMSILVTVSWTIYGLLREDQYIWIPNILSALICFLQFAIFFKYRAISSIGGHGGTLSHVMPAILKERHSYEQLDFAVGRTHNP